MHYKNGREAKLGDRILVPNGHYTFVGVVAELIPGATSCNLYVVPLKSAQLSNAKDCVLVEDALAVGVPTTICTGIAETKPA